MSALSFICLSQNETQTEPVLLAIERQRVNMPERGRMRQHSSHVHSWDSPTGGAAPATPGSSESSPHPSKRVVPPTPSSSASRQISDDDAPLVSTRNSSERQQMLDCPYIAHQAKEGAPGSSVEASPNSEDDRHLPDESYVTQGSYSDGDQGIYTASLTSQGRELGFGTPMHHQRRPATFRSSYDDAVRLLAGPGYEGPVCPENHRLKSRTYKRPAWCDVCEEELERRTGFHCRVCDFDLCTICLEARPAAQSPAVRSPPFRGELVVPIRSPFRGAIQRNLAVGSPPFRGELVVPIRSPFRGAIQRNLAVRSPPFRGELVVPIRSPFRGAIQSHGPAAYAPLLGDVVIDVSDGSPLPPVKVHPFFVSYPGRGSGLGSNELQFRAVARESVASVPVPLPRAGRMRRRNIFPDPPPPTLTTIAEPRACTHTHAQTSPRVMCDANVQTSPRIRLSQSSHSCAQTSPRMYNPLTLADLQREIQVLLIGLGF